MLMIAPMAAVLTIAQPAQAVAPYRSKQGIQAGEVLNLGDPNCGYTDSANQLLADTELQARGGWLRLDMRGSVSVACARAKYVEFIGLLDPDIRVIGLLDYDFFNGSATDFATHAQSMACDTAFSRVRTWQIWNEPDFTDTPLTAEAFGELLARTSAAVDDCGDTIISGGVTPADPNGYLHRTDDAIRANPGWGKSSLDDAVEGIGGHAYVHAIRSSENKTENSRHQPLADFIWGMTDSPESLGIPLWITEFGFRLPDTGTVDEPDEVDAGDQCINLVSAFDLLTADAEVAAGTWFTLKDFGDLRRLYGLYDGGVARLARWGYVHDTCHGPTDGNYNPTTQQLGWQPGTSPALATAKGQAGVMATSYEVLLAPTASLIYTRVIPTGNTFIDLDQLNPPLPLGTYVWRVIKIVNGVRYPSTVQWLFSYQGTPAAPSAPSATANADGTSVTVRWQDNSGTENNFIVTSNGVSNTAPLNATSYTWTGLTPGISYCFTVRASNVYGQSQSTSQVCATTPTAPTAPSSVTATVVTGTSVRIDWADNSTNETRFEVSDGTTTYATGANATSYTWTGIANGANKCFRVRSGNAVGYSAWAGNACATTPTIPAAPTGPTATVVTGTSIRIGWADRSTNEWGFEISDGTTSQVVGANVITYTWGGIPNGTNKCFRVRSYNLAGYSAWTANVCATTPTIPVAPAGQTATVVNGNSIRINWTDRSTNEMGFEIGNSVTSNVVGANGTSFTWTGLANGTYMCFNVRAYNLAGYSAWTPWACATTPTIPAAPTNQSAVAVSGSQISVSWADRSGNETGFQVYDGVNYFTVGANVTSFQRTGLAPGTYMCFAIRSFNAAGYSAFTPYACTYSLSPPAAPTNQTATAISTSQIRVTWADRSGNETGFQIYDGVNYFTVGANVTSFVRSGLASRTWMCFAIRSFNSAGYSAFTPYACTYSL